MMICIQIYFKIAAKLVRPLLEQMLFLTLFIFLYFIHDFCLLLQTISHVNYIHMQLFCSSDLRSMAVSVASTGSSVIFIQLRAGVRGLASWGDTLKFGSAAPKSVH